MQTYTKMINAPVKFYQEQTDPGQTATATGQFDPSLGFELSLGDRTMWLAPKTFKMLEMTTVDGEKIELGDNFKRLRRLGTPHQIYAQDIICKALKHQTQSWKNTTKHLVCSQCGTHVEE
jgi:hypothetical protein